MEQNAPRLRFPGFSGEWEKKALGDIIVQIKRKDSESKAPVMMISATEGFIKQSEKYSRDNAGKSLKKYTILHKGELAYNHGASKIRPYGSSFVLKEKEARVPFVYHSFSTKDNPEFLEKTLNGRYTQKQLKRVITSGARMDGLLNITFENFAKIKVSLPSLPEQEKIADFFSALDEKIDLKEKEIEDVKAMKKGFLQKMFPQDGESVPRLRFPGFSGEWEKKALGEIVQRKNKKGISDRQTPSVEYEDINAKEGTLNKNIYNKMIGKKGILFDKDDIVYGKLRPYLGNWINPTFKGVAVGDFWILKPKAKLAKVFLYYLIQGTEFQKIANQSIGTKMPRADWKLIANTVFAFPSIPEQEKIADFFSALDEKIDAMEKQLEDLKEMKKGFLQQMFI